MQLDKLLQFLFYECQNYPRSIEKNDKTFLSQNKEYELYPNPNKIKKKSPIGIMFCFHYTILLLKKQVVFVLGSMN